MRRLLGVIPLAAALLVGHPGRGDAGLITFEARHLVDSSAIEGVAPGDVLVTTFVLDTQSPDLDASPLRGSYQMDSALTRLTVTAGDDTSTLLLELFAYLADVLSASQDQVAEEAFLETRGSRGVNRLTMLLAFDRGVFPDDRLPRKAPDPDTFREDHSRYLIETDAGSVTAGGLESLTVIARVPAPGTGATLALAAVGLLGLVAVRRSRAARACRPSWHNRP